jgi:hypothetical protein
MPCWRAVQAEGVRAVVSRGPAWQIKYYSWVGAVEIVCGCMWVVPQAVRRWAGATRAECSRE